MEKGMKIFDSERKIMEELWDRGELRASELVQILHDKTGWNRNTTYTIIKKCVEKGAIKRIEPKFMCRAMVSREEVQYYDTKKLLQNLFQGDKAALQQFIEENF